MRLDVFHALRDLRAEEIGPLAPRVSAGTQLSQRAQQSVRAVIGAMWGCPHMALVGAFFDYAACLASKCARAFFPSLAAAVMLSKKTGEDSIGGHLPAR